MRVLSNELVKNAGQAVECAGWVRSVRGLGKLMFLVIADRAGKFQAVAKKPEVLEKVSKLGLEDVVILKGTAKADERTAGGAELEVDDVVVLSTAHRSLPVDVAGKTETNFEARFDHRVLDLRRDKQQAIFKVQHTVCAAFRDCLSKMGFLEIHTPKIIATGTEGGANLFPVIYFDREAFLAQSPQFYKQMLVGSGFERVFEVASVYRAEEHDTPFHLNEYVSLDLEMGFIKDETDVMNVTKEAMKAIFTRVAEENNKELEALGASITPPKDIPVVHYWELPKAMESVGRTMADPLADLTRDDEEALCRWAKEKHGTEFVFIDNYPAAKRPAYTMPYEENPTFTRGYDLLYAGLELVTGGQRIHQYDLLRQKFQEKGYDVDAFEFYFEVFKYGMPPHGGQAIGLERITMKMLGQANVREACYFPRDKKRLTP